MDTREQTVATLASQLRAQSDEEKIASLKILQQMDERLMLEVMTEMMGLAPQSEAVTPLAHGKQAKDSIPYAK